MVAISRTHPSTPDHSDSPDDRVAILLMGYGEVESYEDFANYNEHLRLYLLGFIHPSLSF